MQTYKPDLTVDAGTYNPLTAHSVDTLDNADQNQMIGRGFNPFIVRGKVGGMIVRRFDY